MTNFIYAYGSLLSSARPPPTPSPSCRYEVSNFTLFSSRTKHTIAQRALRFCLKGNSHHANKNVTKTAGRAEREIVSARTVSHGECGDHVKMMRRRKSKQYGQRDREGYCTLMDTKETRAIARRAHTDTGTDINPMHTE